MSQLPFLMLVHSNVNPPEAYCDRYARQPEQRPCEDCSRPTRMAYVLDDYDGRSVTRVCLECLVAGPWRLPNLRLVAS